MLSGSNELWLVSGKLGHGYQGATSPVFGPRGYFLLFYMKYVKGRKSRFEIAPG